MMEPLIFGRAILLLDVPSYRLLAAVPPYRGDEVALRPNLFDQNSPPHSLSLTRGTRLNTSRAVKLFTVRTIFVGL